MFNKNKDYISVVFGEETIRLAQIRFSSSKVEILNVVKRDIRGVSEDELPAIIQAVLKDFDVKKPQAIAVVSSNIATTKNIEIPSLDSTEIKSIIDLQAGRHTPYSREEIIIDYVNIGIYQRNYSKIFLVIVNRSNVKNQLNIIEKAGLKVQKVLFASEGIACFYSKILHVEQDENTIGIIDIGSQFTDFSIAFRGTVITCRNLPIGAAHLVTEGKPAMERFTAELKKSIESYQSEDIEKLPGRYILTNDVEYNKELQPLLKAALDVNVDVVSYLDHVSVMPEARKYIKDIGDETFLDLIAPALAMTESRIDLVPEEVKMQRAIEQQGIEVVKSGILVLVTLAFLCGIFFSKVYFRSNVFSQLKVSHGTQRKEAKALEKIAEKTRLVKDFLDNRMVSLDTINELYNIIPAEIYLKSVNLDENGKISIEGISESMSRVFSLVGDLEDSDLFKGVKTTSTTAKKERGKDVAVFQIVFRLESAKDEDEEELQEIEEVEVKE